jgi:hypothetical protein
LAKKPSLEKRQPWEVDFCHIELDSAQKKAVQTWDSTGEASLLQLENHLLAGCKLSYVHDVRNDCCICSITTAKVEGGERQLCISARGPDMIAATRVLAYKLEKILDGDLSTARETAEARGQWG